jgi:hypothetical protein
MKIFTNMFQLPLIACEVQNSLSASSLQTSSIHNLPYCKRQTYTFTQNNRQAMVLSILIFKPFNNSRKNKTF